MESRQVFEGGPLSLETNILGFFKAFFLIFMLDKTSLGGVKQNLFRCLKQIQDVQHFNGPVFGDKFADQPIFDGCASFPPKNLLPCLCYLTFG